MIANLTNDKVAEMMSNKDDLKIGKHLWTEDKNQMNVKNVVQNLRFFSVVIIVVFVEDYYVTIVRNIEFTNNVHVTNAIA